MPRAEWEINPDTRVGVKGHAEFQLRFVNEEEEKAHHCRKLLVQRSGCWHLTTNGLREPERLT